MFYVHGVYLFVHGCYLNVQACTLISHALKFFYGREKALIRLG